MRSICSKIIFLIIFLITTSFVIKSFFPIYLTSEQIGIFAEETGMSPTHAYRLLKENQNLNSRYEHFIYGVSQGEYIITEGLIRSPITTSDGYWINPKTKRIRKIKKSHFIIPIVMRNGILSFPQSYDEIFISVIDTSDPLFAEQYASNMSVLYLVFNTFLFIIETQANTNMYLPELYKLQIKYLIHC